METYLLWNPSLDEKTQSLSFFVTAVNIQRIEKVTREMLDAMLKNLGIHDAKFKDWTVKRFLTNYLTDDPESEDWRDSWAETWEITLQIRSHLVLNTNQFYPLRTWEHDHSWNGETWIFPVECAIIADFDNVDIVAQARYILEKLTMLQNNPSLALELNTAVPEAGPELFENIRRELLNRHQQSELRVTQRASYPLRLIISLGTVDESFFTEGAKLATLISGLCDKLGGITTHDAAPDAQL